MFTICYQSNKFYTESIELVNYILCRESFEVYIRKFYSIIPIYKKMFEGNLTKLKT